MDTQALLTAIGSYGFPIVMCIILIWIMRTTLADMTKSIDNNTSVIQRLLDRLDK